MSAPIPDTAKWIRQQIQRDDESKFEQRVARALRTKVHNMIPNHWFSVASSECRDMFRDAHFNGCVCLVQAIAEGLTKFLVKFHPRAKGNDQTVRVVNLYKEKVISDECRQAFTRITGTDRNTFHHLNEDIPTDWEELERRAEECVRALYQVESEIFAYNTTPDGAMVPTQPRYWPQSDKEHLQVYLRCNY